MEGRTRVSIPFFFEPNWDAAVRPLDAARRIVEEEGGERPRGKVYDEVTYGDFLLKKVTNNFAGGGKYA